MEARASHREIDHFNLWAPTYEKSRLQHYIGRLHDAMLDCAAEAVSSPAQVLDIGCGTGRLLRKVAQRWPAAHLIGVDPAEGMIAAARPLAAKIDFFVASAESLPVPAGSMDLAFSAISLHHWTQQLQGLQQIAGALRPGGVFCLADITMPGWLSQLFRSSVQNPNGLRQLMVEAGFELQAERRVFARAVLILLGRKARAAD
jgi:ubiquinone/menaquinone biosynthesis C-methylase UbiE